MRHIRFVPSLSLAILATFLVASTGSALLHGAGRAEPDTLQQPAGRFLIDIPGAEWTGEARSNDWGGLLRPDKITIYIRHEGTRLGTWNQGRTPCPGACADLMLPRKFEERIADQVLLPYIQAVDKGKDVHFVVDKNISLGGHLAGKPHEHKWAAEVVDYISARAPAGTGILATFSDGTLTLRDIRNLSRYQMIVTASPQGLDRMDTLRLVRTARNLPPTFIVTAETDFMRLNEKEIRELTAHRNVTVVKLLNREVPWRTHGRLDDLGTRGPFKVMTRTSTRIHNGSLGELLGGRGQPDIKSATRVAETSRFQKLEEDDRRKALPSVPPPGGGGTAKPLGGIDLGVSVEWTAGTLPRMHALVTDPWANALVLAGDADRALPGMTLRDLAMALWLVFGPRPQDPKFSLDPADRTNPRGEWLKAVYIPAELRGRSFGAGLYEADFLLKEYAFGVSVDAAGKTHERKSSVAGWKSVVHLLYEENGRRASEAQWARYWIVPDRVRIKRAENSIYFDEVKMRVRARHQVPDRSSPSGLRDIDTDEHSIEMRWANLFTQHYDKIAAESPAFARVKELAKAMAIAKWLKLEGVQVDLDWVVQQLNTDAATAVDRVTALSVSWKKQERQPFTTASGQGIRTIIHEMRLFGGVDLSVMPTFTLDDGVARSIREAVRTKLSGNQHRTTFAVDFRGRVLQAIILPIIRSVEASKRQK